jgi:NADH dehydrogenase (ubiquinone) 1 alpha subcomplex subunit 10
MTKSLIIVEGNIAAGKTTLCKNLAQKLKYKVFLEPHVDNPYLEKFYKNPKKYALTLQLYMLRIRFQTYIEALNMLNSNDPSFEGILLDRSIFSDWVFAKMNYDDGNISEEGYCYYMRVRQNMLADLPVPMATIYLKVDPAICLERILNIRGVACESAVTLPYLEGLEKIYLHMIHHMKKVGSNVLEFNWNDWNDSQDVADALILFGREQQGKKVLLNSLNQDQIDERMILPNDSSIVLYFDE